MTNLEKYGGLALLALAGYVIYKSVQTGKAVVQSAQDAYNASRGWVADTLYDLIGPKESFGPNTFLTVTFVEPGAPRHSIGIDQVAADGTFIYGSKTYKLANNAQGQHFAVPMPS